MINVVKCKNGSEFIIFCVTCGSLTASCSPNLPLSWTLVPAWADSTGLLLPDPKQSDKLCLCMWVWRLTSIQSSIAKSELASQEWHSHSKWAMHDRKIHMKNAARWATFPWYEWDFKNQRTGLVTGSWFLSTASMSFIYHYSSNDYNYSSLRTLQPLRTAFIMQWKSGYEFVLVLYMLL